MVSARLRASSSPCTLPPNGCLLHTSLVSNRLQSPMTDVGLVNRPGRPMLHAVLLQPPWRLSTARPNVQHGAGAANGIFIPIRRYIRVLCVHAQLSAKEEQQNIAATRGNRPAASSLAPQHRPTQRTALCRSNKRDFHPDMTIHKCSMCACTTLCIRKAAEYRCNTRNSAGTPPAQDSTPFSFPRRNIKQINKSGMYEGPALWGVA